MKHNRHAQQMKESKASVQLCAIRADFPFSAGGFTLHPRESMWSGWGKRNTALSVCNVVLVCAFQPCCTDSCQWQSDASQWAHVTYYVRWTGHDIMSRLTSRFLIGQTVITYIFLWKYFTTKAWSEQVSTQRTISLLDKRAFAHATCNHQQNDLSKAH